MIVSCNWISLFAGYACCKRKQTFTIKKVTPWLNWIEQPPPKGQVAGSNPAGVATFLLKNRCFTQWNS